MFRTYTAEAIIIKRLNLNEADRLLTIFAKNYGKKKIMAKGIRRLTSRKKGHLELFNQARLFIAKGKNIDIVTEAKTINNFSNLRKNLSSVRIAYLFAELIDQLTAEEQENNQVYNLLLDNLSQLNQTRINKNIIIDFEKSLLQLLGFGLPKTISKQSLESHIASITEKPLNSKKIR